MGTPLYAYRFGVIDSMSLTMMSKMMMMMMLMCIVCSDAEAVRSQQPTRTLQRRPILVQRRQEEKEGKVKTGVYGNNPLSSSVMYLIVFMRRSI